MDTITIRVNTNKAKINRQHQFLADLPISEVISFDANALVLKTPTWSYVLPPGVEVPVPLSYRIYTVASVQYSRSEDPNEQFIAIWGELIAAFPVSPKKQKGNFSNKIEKRFTRGPFIAKDYWEKANETPRFMRELRSDYDLARFQKDAV